MMASRKMMASPMSFIFTLALAFIFTSASPTEGSDGGNLFEISLGDRASDGENPFDINMGDVRHSVPRCRLVNYRGAYYWTSPHFGWSSKYPRNVNCSIHGSSAWPLAVEVSFLSFNLQKALDSSDEDTCCDYVMFTYPGGFERKFCGSQSGRRFVLPSSSFEAFFYSDNSLTSRGFKISLRLKNTFCHKIIKLNYLGDTGSVGSVSKTLPNPFGEGGCEYWIIAPKNLSVLVEFESFNLGEGDCEENNLSINLDGDRTYPVESSTTLCQEDFGNRLRQPALPGPYYSSGNEVDLVYTSSTMNSGFRVQYTAVQPNI